MEALGLDLATFVGQLVSFLILLGLLIFFGYKPVRKMLEERSNRIKESMERAEATKQEYGRAQVEVQEQISEAREQGQSIIAQAKQEAEKLKEKARQEARQEAQAKAKADFEKTIGKLINKLPHPEDVHNVYLRWSEVDEAIPDSELVEVEVTNAEGIKSMEMRQPMVKVMQWVVELNKGFTVGKGASATPTTTKRAVTVNKRNGQTLEFVGNFPSASKACEYLKLIIGGDSATRVLARDGYILDPYTGTDFTS